MEQAVELPDFVIINGARYERARDYSDDSATQLLKRIRGVSDATGAPWHLAAWAVLLEDYTVLPSASLPALPS